MEGRLIRKAVLEDADRLSEIVVYGWRTAYKDLIPDSYLYGKMSVVKRHARFLEQLSQPHDYFVYEESETGLVKGFIVATDCRDEDSTDKDYEVIAIYVEPAYKSQGIGSKLIAFSEALALEHGKNRMKLWVLSGNTNSRKFYEKQGYMPDGCQKILEMFNIEEIRYSKWLKLGEASDAL